MFVLSSHITVGDYSFTAVHEVTIKKSIHSYEDTASITIPASARLQYNKDQASPTVSINSVAASFKEGDPVTISLGYNGKLETEFTGFVKRVNFTTPFEIECEGFIWLLRNKNNLISFNSANTSVSGILKLITDKFPDITIAQGIEDIKFGPFAVDKITGAELLEKLKEAGFTVYFIDGNTIYCGLLYIAQLQSKVNYSLGWNTIKDNGLVYRTKDDTRVNVTVDFKDDKGKTISKNYGPGDVNVAPKKLRLHYLVSADDRKKFVNAFARKYRYAGYEGRIIAFLQPYAQHGWSANITDSKFSDRNGNYILESIEVLYGNRGARRIAEIGRTLNPQEELEEQA